MATQQGSASRLAQMQMRFQQKQLQEREQKKMELTTTSVRSLGNLDTTTVDSRKLSGSLGPGKVRQLFEERRHRVTGIDKSYPLQPISTKTSPTTMKSMTKTTTTTTTKNNHQRAGTQIRTNGELRTRSNNLPLSADRVDHYEGSEYIQSTVKTNGNLVSSISTSRHFEGSDSTDLEDPNQFGDFLDNEKFPEMDDDFLNNSHTIKLPNVGKLASLNLNGNGGGNTIANINNNNIKLKPVVTKKSVASDPVKPLNGSKKLTSLNKSKPIKSPIVRNTNNNSTNGNGGVSPPERTVNAIEKKTTPSTSEKATPTTTPVKKMIVKAHVKSTRNSGSSVMASAPLSSNRVPTGPPPENSASCKICGRYFAEDRVAKHETICEKTATKRRKIFDASKHRVQGTEAEKYLKKTGKGVRAKAASSVTAVATTSGGDKNKKSDWRRKHEEFIAAIRAAKELQAHLAKGGKLSDLPPPPPSENPDYIQCPHCQRRFNEAAATRHIPKCATMLHNKPKPPAKKR